MKFKSILYLTVLLTSCSTKVEVTDVQIKELGEGESIVETMISESTSHYGTFQDEFLDQDTAINLKPIQENYNRINSIEIWDTILEREFHESSDGGYTFYYYKNNILEKVMRKDFGESGRSLLEYYLFESKISFVHHQIHEYNMPYYMDSLFYVENEMHGEIFDMKKSNISEFRSYFQNEVLVSMSTNLDSTSVNNYQELHYSKFELTKELNRLLD